MTSQIYPGHTHTKKDVPNKEYLLARFCTHREPPHMNEICNTKSFVYSLSSKPPWNYWSFTCRFYRHPNVLCMSHTLIKDYKWKKNNVQGIGYTKRTGKTSKVSDDEWRRSKALLMSSTKTQNPTTDIGNHLKRRVAWGSSKPNRERIINERKLAYKCVAHFCFIYVIIYSLIVKKRNSRKLNID